MEGFMLYTAQYPAIKTMTQEQKGDLLDALYAYAIDGAQISAEADPMVQMAFAFIRDAIDRAQGKYEAKCERNRQTALKREQKKREAQTYTNVHERVPQSTNVHERGKTAQTCTAKHERARMFTYKNKTKQNKTKQNKPLYRKRGERKRKRKSASGRFFFGPLAHPHPHGREFWRK